MDYRAKRWLTLLAVVVVFCSAALWGLLTVAGPLASGTVPALEASAGPGSKWSDDGGGLERLAAGSAVRAPTPFAAYTPVARDSDEERSEPIYHPSMSVSVLVDYDGDGVFHQTESGDAPPIVAITP